jgi:transcriptional regulator with XRE-family HTH domain
MRICYVFPMRPSPFRHTLAVLRTAIGLTQKEMAALVDRAARTIQSIELGKLPLSEDLAMTLAQATGVDAGWLLEDNPATPPRKGLTVDNLGTGIGEYTRSDYEFHRAFLDSPVASPELMAAFVREAEKGQTKGKKRVTMPLPVMKAALLPYKKKLLHAQDQQTLEALKQLLDKTVATPAGDLLRWKIRRFLQTLAGENSVKLDLKASPDMAIAHIHIVEEQTKTPARPRKTKN